MKKLRSIIPIRSHRTVKLISRRVLVVVGTVILTSNFFACGGGGGSKQNFVQTTPPPPPPIPPLTITTTSLASGTVSQFYSATLQASGGTGNRTWAITQGALPPDMVLNPATGVIAGVPTASLVAQFQVQATDSSSPPQTTSQNLSLTINAVSLSIVTSLLPPGTVNHFYKVTLAGEGGAIPYSWTINPASLPPGISQSGVGEISGTPTTTGNFSVSVQLEDASAKKVSRTLSLQIVPSGVRNDSISNATPISNGTIHASISPYDSSGSDSDYYRLSAAPGAIVKVELPDDPTSPLDPIVEIVDANGTRLASCSDTSAGPFSGACIGDFEDDPPVLPSPLLFFQAPAASTPTTFFVHVLDWRGDARPDMLYDLKISRAN